MFFSLRVGCGMKGRMSHLGLRGREGLFLGGGGGVWCGESRDKGGFGVIWCGGWNGTA